MFISTTSGADNDDIVVWVGSRLHVCGGMPSASLQYEGVHRTCALRSRGMSFVAGRDTETKNIVICQLRPSADDDVTTT